MKNKKFLSTLVVVFAILLTSIFSGCGHKHTYSADWSNNNTHHWHAAICEHTEEKSGYEQHIFDDDLDTTCNDCGKVRVLPHTHAYTGVSYIIEDGKAYKVTTCGCDDFTKEEMIDAIIATPDTAHDLINTTNNKTIVLSTGTYALDALRFDHYNTPTNNLKIVGVEGAEVSRIYASVHDGAKITNLYIGNIKFTGQGVHSNHTDIEGITVENCEFTGSYGLSFGNNLVKDVVVRNCKFDLDGTVDTQTAIYFNNGVQNFIVEDCVFTNVPYNAIQANNASVSGNITIKNNNFVKTGSRVIYLNGVTDVESVTLTIEGNIFCIPTTPKSEGNLVKLGAVVEISKNNTWQIESDKAEDYYFAGAVVKD